MNDELFTIAEIAARTGLSVHTLRYYERIGLLDPVGRAGNGHRRYAARDLDWIAFLTRLRATGMSIRAMQEYAALRREGESTLAARRRLLEGHRHVVAERVAELRRNLAAIDDKIAIYKQMEEDHDDTL